MRDKQLLATRRETLSSRLDSLKNIRISRPRKGWIAEMRNVLGMRSQQLALRLGVSQSTLSNFEKSEREKRITLQSLENVAEALNCELYYCFLPKQNMNALLMKRAQSVIEKEDRRICQTMALEDQPISTDSGIKQAVRAAILIQEQDRRIWEEDE